MSTSGSRRYGVIRYGISRNGELPLARLFVNGQEKTYCLRTKLHTTLSTLGIKNEADRDAFIRKYVTDAKLIHTTTAPGKATGQTSVPFRYEVTFKSSNGRTVRIDSTWDLTEHIKKVLIPDWNACKQTSTAAAAAAGPLAAKRGSDPEAPADGTAVVRRRSSRLSATQLAPGTPVANTAAAAAPAAAPAAAAHVCPGTGAVHVGPSPAAALSPAIQRTSARRSVRRRMNAGVVACQHDTMPAGRRLSPAAPAAALNSLPDEISPVGRPAGRITNTGEARAQTLCAAAAAADGEGLTTTRSSEAARLITQCSVSAAAPAQTSVMAPAKAEPATTALAPPPTAAAAAKKGGCAAATTTPKVARQSRFCAAALLYAVMPTLPPAELTQAAEVMAPAGVAAAAVRGTEAATQRTSTAARVLRKRSVPGEDSTQNPVSAAAAAVDPAAVAKAEGAAPGRDLTAGRSVRMRLDPTAATTGTSLPAAAAVGGGAAIASASIDISTRARKLPTPSTNAQVSKPTAAAPTAAGVSKANAPMDAAPPPARPVRRSARTAVNAAATAAAPLASSALGLAESPPSPPAQHVARAAELPVMQHPGLPTASVTQPVTLAAAVAISTAANATAAAVPVAAPTAVTSPAAATAVTTPPTAGAGLMSGSAQMICAATRNPQLYEDPVFLQAMQLMIQKELAQQDTNKQVLQLCRNILLQNGTGPAAAADALAAAHGPSDGSIRPLRSAV